ncbi:InlB B-repeat-containing protein [Holdemanella biformis]|uniref:InlB B-repeat-containing protein n=1 Tax=Holdemanella biformis TaxID=1735 RepID=UPI002E7804DC|nr:InlB B-repeat-containing protein [Holdemanella biformis]
MLKNLKRAASIALSFAMAIQFGLADSYRVNAVEEPTDSTIVESANTNETVETSTPQEEAPEPEAVTTENTQSDAVATPVEAETQSVELSYVAEDGTILKMAALRDFDLNHNLNTDTSVMLNFDGYTLKDVVINNLQTVAADQVNLDATSALNSVKFIYKAKVVENNNVEKVDEPETKTEETKTEEASGDDAEADPDPETEVKEELPEYPAFDESATAGNVTVHATAAEGVLPRDSKLVVKNVARKAILNAVKETVSEKNKEVDSAVALDVVIVNKDGVEIQPNGVVNISFENAAVNGDEINVYHVSDDASAVTEVATNTQSFNTNHFSIYVITGENEVPLTTFNFVANGNIVSTQIVKTGDTLITPTAPDMDGKAFVGWYDGETKFEDFNTALTITETTTREITAKYEDALYVYFYNPDGTQIMRTEKVSDHEAHDFTNISYEVDATHKIVGWAAKKNGTTNIADKITVPTDKTSVNVYAIIKEGYWISFDSDGGSIVDSQFVLHGDKLTLNKSTTPTKPGYEFAGWYNGLSKVENGATVASSMTLTAHWNAAEVSYTVIHWWENADDDGYSFHESETKTGLTGTEVNAAAKSYSGFTAQPVTKKTIKGDGSTIVSVYYKRNVYDVKFYSYSSWYTSSKEYTDLRITAKYGQDISKKWPTYKGSSTWSTTDDSGPYQVNIGTMPLGGAKFYGPETGNGSETAYYYVEVLPGEPSDVTKDGIRYKLDHKDTSPGTGYSVTKEDQYPLTGYTFNENVSTRIRSKYNNAKFYYTRNSYKIKFINKGKEDKSVEKKYEQSISSENYTPVRPGSLPDYYEFDGWYDNELCEGEAFDFNGKKMPAQNVTLYAKWTAKKINLTYNLNNPEGDVVKGSKNVEAGTIANTVLPSATTTSDYSFAGWYYADGNGNITSDAYNTNEAITKDTSVIGKWLYNGELKVVYDPGTEGSKATVPTDSNIYAGGAKVTVAKNATTTSKKKFLGWKLKGNLYHPGDAFEVNKDLANNDNIITLTAIWGNEESSTTMSYNPGNGRGSVQTVPVKNNESVTLKSEKDFGYQAPETEGKEYYFAGWATSKDDADNGKATYAAGQSVHVDVDGENVLYATWIEKTVITLVANSNTVTYNGEAQSIEGFKDVTDGYTITGLSAKATGTDFGEYKTEIKGTAKVTKDGKDVTEKVVVNVVPGQLTISKREVTLESETKSKPYDGTPLTRPDVKMTGSFVNGEVSDIKATGSVTNVSEGKVTNTITYKTSDKFNPDNYTIVVKEGKLSIDASTEKVTVNIKEHSGTHTYDSNEKTVEGYDVKSISNPLYTADDFKFNGTAKVSGTNAGTYDMEINVADFENKNTNFANVEFVIAEEGQLVIDKRSVTLESDTKSKPYDGTPLTRPDVKMTGSFVNGEVSDVKATGSVTNVEEGSVTNPITYKTENKFNPDNYSIVVKEGKLSITPVTDNVVVEIKGKTKTETYNGNTYEVEGYDVTKISDELYPEEVIHFEGTAKASRKEEGTSYMGLNATQFSNTSANFTNVTFRVTDGWLKVTPKSIDPEDEKTGIKVTKPEDTMYNGEEQKNKPTVEDTKTGATLVENVDYTLSYTAAVNAGTVEVTITGKGNYTGTAKTSYEITKRNVTLTSANDSKPYDKTPLTNSNVTIGGDGFVKEEGATYNVTGSQTEKGTSNNTFTYELKSNTKASNYIITKEFGKLTVTAEDGEVVVIITGRKDTFEYDGTEKSVKGYDVSITEGSTYTESDFTFSGNDEVKGTEAGTYDMGLKPEDFTNNNENYGNVTFRATDGQLIITPKSINPEDEKSGIEATDPADSIYDGEAHVNPLTVRDTKTGKDLVENKDYTLTYVGDVVNVGTVKIEVKGIGNYTGEFTKKYQITPREYTVTTDNAEKPYDGTALTAGGRVNGLAEGETVIFKTTGSQTNEGTSDNTYELKFEGTAVETNYKHGKDSIGQLKVTKKSIVPDGPNTPDDKKTGIKVTKPDDTMYNGKEQKNKPVVRDTKRDVKLVEDTDYTLSYTAAVNAGTVTVTITGIGNYEGTVNTSYEITPRKVTMTSADDTKVYDGNALTKKKVTESGNGFVEGEGATYDVTGSQTDVGFSNNTFSYTLNKGTLASNYTIETKEGKLEVTPLTDKVTVTITGNKDTAVYDGKSHSVEGYDVTNISNALYKKADIQFNGTAKAEGIEVGTYTMKLTPAQFENKNRNFADVEFVVNDGKLEITPKSIDPEDEKTGIKVTKPEDTMYNGEEQKNKPTVEDTKTGATLVENVDYTLSYTAAVNAGTVEVTITGIGNYTGTAKTSYEITKRDVLLTSATDSKVYDKKPLMNGKVTESGSGFVKEEGATYNVTGSQTKKGSSKNEFTYELKSNTKASNYTIKVVYGDLTVTAEDGEVVVVITGHKKSFEYDGNEKSVKGYDVSITKGSTYEVSDFTFNGNDEVKGTEAGTYDMGLKPEDFTNNNENYGNVTFRVTDGQLIITPKSITPDGPNTPEDKKTGITATDPADSIYDGKAHVNPLKVTDTKTGKDLVENKDYTLTYVGDVINVGTVKIEVKGIRNYTGEFTKKYQITPREYTVTTDSAEKPYDGTALTAGGRVNGLVEGETVNFKTTGSQTNAGTSDNTYELKFKGTAVETNYKHGKDSIGTLTVKKQSIDPGEDPDKPNPDYLGIEISNPSDEVYDGKEHKWSPTVVDKIGKDLIVGTDYAVEYETSDFTNVGTITVTITGVGNYTGKVTRTYSITPREYTITTLDGTKVYDGKALTNFGLVDGIVYGETYSFKTTGSQTEVGSSDNTYEFKWDGTALKSNYKLAKESIGKLTVKAKSIIPDEPDTPEEKKTGITVNEPSDSMYDGQEHKEVLTVSDTRSLKALEADKDYSVTYTGDLVNAGTVTITVTGKGNYTGTFTKTYKITKRSVTLTSATESKTYDGNPLTNTSITVSGDGFAKGEGATYEVTGSQTEVGDSANAFEYKLNENTLASNYDITKVVGTLTVTRDTTPVTPAPTPTTPSVPPVVQRVVPTPTPVPEEKVEEEQTPKAEPKEEEKVEEDYTPKATQEYYWALINLICAIVTVLFGLLLLISKRHKDEDDEEEDDETKQQATTNEDEEQEQEKKRGLFTRVLAVLIAIVSVVFFLVTEDMSLAWTWTDQWTIWMVVIGLVQIVVFFVGRKWKNVDNDDEDEQTQQA